MQEGSPEPSNPVIRHQRDPDITRHGGKQRGPRMGESVPDTPAKSCLSLAHPDAPARQSRAGGGTGERSALLLQGGAASANRSSTLLAAHPSLRLSNPFPHRCPWPGHQQCLTIPTSQSAFLWGVFVAPRGWEVSPRAGFGLKKMGTLDWGVCSAPNLIVGGLERDAAGCDQTG